jgi:reductive dehalogenase
MQMHWFYFATGLIYSFGILGFAITSFAEVERRAGGLALLVTLVFSVSWFGIGMLLPAATAGLAIAAWATILLLIVILAIPVGNPAPLEINPTKTERFDERNIMFGRAELKPGTTQYETYYRDLNAGMQEADDHIRAMPELGAPGSLYYNELDSPYMVSIFEFIEKFRHLADTEAPSGEPPKITPVETTRRLKGFARYLGALDARVTRLRPYHVYSHAGRHLHNWGQELSVTHKYALVFSVEMHPRMVHTAPLLPPATESAAEYMRAANIAICLANYIKNLGYPARAHIDGNYHVLTTAIAHDAGLGELGRLGLIITPSHGPRVRTAVVTTDIPLIEDQPINIGVQHFCEICKKCADNCPSQSIEIGNKKPVRGVNKWQSRMESCYQYWRRVGTDCSLCLAVCPYSKPDTFYHRILRFFINRNALARRVAFHMDDLLYGRKPRHFDKPGWFS